MQELLEQVSITEDAAEQILEIIRAEGPDFKANLRIYVQGGGCSGFQYGFTFDEVVAEDDMIFEKNGARVLVDTLSLQYLVGSTIDYKKSIAGSNFVITNPNVVSTCGCGSSFST